MVLLSTMVIALGSGNTLSTNEVSKELDALKTAQIDLVEGWNLISLPLEQKDTIIDSVLAPIDGQYNSVWTYQANPGWLWYLPEFPFASNLWNMDAGMGYWVDMKEAVSLTIQGDDPLMVVRLWKGWNLVGYN